MKTTNATAIGTYINLQADDLDEMDFQWNDNQSSVHALYYSRAILHNVTEPNVFNVSSPHTTFHSTSRIEVESNVQTIPLTGLPRELNGSSTASPLDR